MCRWLHAPSLQLLWCANLWREEPRYCAPSISSSHNCSHEAGGGSLLLAVRDSTHDTFSDLPVLFVKRFSWLLQKVGSGFENYN